MKETPFPDPIPLKPTSATKRSGLATVLGMTVFGAALGVGIVGLIRSGFGSNTGDILWTHLSMDLWTALLLPIILWICVLVHEAGHLLGGWLGGMRALMLFAGPLHLDFNAGRTRVLFNRVPATWTGLAVCSPRSEKGATSGNYALLVSGGPLASLVFTAVTSPIAFTLGGWLGGLLIVTGALSLVIGIATLIPTRMSGFTSDGGQLLGLARGDQVTRQRLALGALLGQSYGGVRPRDWDPGLLQVIGEDSGDVTLRITSAMLEASRAEDKGDLDTADANLREVAAILVGEQGTRITAVAWAAFALGLAGWIGQHRREGASARRWLEASKGGFSEPAARAHAESACALAEGDLESAKLHLDEARTALTKMTDRGGALMLADSLDDLERELETKRKNAGTESSSALATTGNRKQPS